MCSSIALTILSIQAYEYKTVDTNETTKPNLTFMPAHHAKLFITNQTGHPIKNVKVMFNFVGRRGLLHDKLVYKNHELGGVETGVIPSGATAAIRAREALNFDAGIKPIEHYGNVENVVALCLGKDMYTYHLHQHNMNENHFVISRMDTYDAIETHKNYKHRLQEFRKSLKTSTRKK
jgi:hypothetical protein